jgi:hypothetical protein
MLPLPLSPVLALLGLPSAVTLYTKTTTIGSDGYPSTSEVSTTIQAIVAPAGYRDVERLPEGHRTSASLVVLSASRLAVDQELSYTQPGDAGAQRWVFMMVDDWKTQTGHYRGICVAR